MKAPHTTDAKSTPVSSVSLPEEEHKPAAPEACGKAETGNAPKPSAEVKKSAANKIDLVRLFTALWRGRYKFILPLVVVGLIGTKVVLSMPKVYKVTVMMAPEYSTSSGVSGGLGSLASIAGVNLGAAASQDAIVPTFYPDLMGSTEFIVPLFNVGVTTQDGSFTGPLSEYLAKKQKGSLIDKWKNSFRKPKPGPALRSSHGSDRINPFALNKSESELAQAIMGSLSCSVDKKTNVITISTTMQDPLVAALVADTVRQRLQDFIILYRTNKARKELRDAEVLCENAHKEYVRKRSEYAEFVDANQDLVLESFKAKQEDLENEMQLAYNAYSGLSQKVLLAKAKVEERMPVFTTLQNASVPDLPAGPRRTIILAALLMLTTAVTAVFVVLTDKQPKAA